jgi:hydrogenase/urease accessory protein HupE
MSRPLQLMALWLLLAGSLARSASAHGMAPALLEIEELAEHRLAVSWKIPMLQLTGVTLTPVLPPECIRDSAADETSAIDSVTARWVVRCDAQGLVGRTVGVEGLTTGQTDALVRVTLADGHVVQAVLRASEPHLTIPARPGRLDVLRSYGALGVEHILTGVDHLLFIGGLLLLVGGGRRLLQTITAFTAGHSVTLSLAALGIAAMPSRLAEVAIAGSVFILAVELARPTRSTPSLLRRLPWVMAGLFGLLHGLGFAGALAEVGLPVGEIPSALCAFNVGIEAGQLAFVGALLAIGWSVQQVEILRTQRLQRVPVYVMGSLASLWLLERTAALVASGW